MTIPTTQNAALRRRCRNAVESHRRRAKAVGQRLDYGLSDLMNLVVQSPLCAYCRCPLSFSLHFDHMTPISRGGEHQLYNLAVCCERCDQLKGRCNVAEYRALLALLRRLHSAAAQDLERRLLHGGRVYRKREQP